MRHHLKAWSNLWRFHRLADTHKDVVIYSEGRAYSRYLVPVLDKLLASGKVSLVYVTSDIDDPLLASKRDGLDVFYIDQALARTLLFETLKAKVVVMTMPDLERFHIKRSRLHAVHYVYLYHSMVSTHMIYRAGAFDHYDTILCVGPHQCEEIRGWEHMNRLKRKQLIRHGYGPLDWILSKSRSCPMNNRSGPRHVLIAPSWGPTGLIEMGAEALVNTLLHAGYYVTVRPHPRTATISKVAIASLESLFCDDDNFRIDRDFSSSDTLLGAEVMISDWSGVAMEFSFGVERPVLFIDHPRKVNNPRWTEVGITPLEDFYRAEVGAILDPADIDRAPKMIDLLWHARDEIALRARSLREKYIYNVGCSGAVGAEAIESLAEQL